MLYEENLSARSEKIWNDHIDFSDRISSPTAIFAGIGWSASFTQKNIKIWKVAALTFHCDKYCF